MFNDSCEVCHQVVYVYEPDGDGGWTELEEEFLSIKDIINDGGSAVIHSLEVHPDFQENHRCVPAGDYC